MGLKFVDWTDVIVRQVNNTLLGMRLSDPKRKILEFYVTVHPHWPVLCRS